MKNVIDLVANELIENIDSKKDSQQVALQFVLEELDAAQLGNDFVRDRIKSFYFNESEYVGAMNRSWGDVDGESGPQQALLKATNIFAQILGIDLAAALRIYIVEYIARHYQLGRFYISREIEMASKPLALFGDCVGGDNKAHPHFKFLLEDENKPVRDVIVRWASGFEDRDNKLSFEFQTTFNSSFWEIYLHQCLKDLGMVIDFSKAAPDFTAKTKGGKIINIEAVTANHAANSSPEWTSEELRSDSDFLNFSCVRILNAIDSKHKKFLNSYSLLEHVEGKPFIVAVAPFEQPMFFMQNNEAIIRVLYGKGIDKYNGFAAIETPTALKNKDVYLDLGIFTSEKYKEISAVVFSTIATIGKAITQTSLDYVVRCSRYHEERGLVGEIKNNSEHFETHLDGLQVHHNPYAAVPLPPEAFNSYEITHYYYDIPSKIIDNQQKSYTIISRNVIIPVRQKEKNAGLR